MREWLEQQIERPAPALWGWISAAVAIGAVAAAAATALLVP